MVPLLLSPSLLITLNVHISKTIELVLFDVPTLLIGMRYICMHELQNTNCVIPVILHELMFS